VIAASIVEASRALLRTGLTTGTSGNVSVRVGAELVAVTPSGVDPEAMSSSDVVRVRPDGSAAVDNGRRPSSETRFHLAVYEARADVCAIVHTHPPWATAVGCSGADIPPFHYMMVGTGDGTIRCAPYAPPGSARLAAHVVEALGPRQACLLANHGLVTVGADLDGAMEMTREVEALAQQYCLSRLLGGPQVLSTADVEELIPIFENYGKAQESEEP
jgi:L-fuculose-phosphate aldolase